MLPDGVAVSVVSLTLVKASADSSTGVGAVDACQSQLREGLGDDIGKSAGVLG